MARKQALSAADYWRYAEARFGRLGSELLLLLLDGHVGSLSKVPLLVNAALAVHRRVGTLPAAEHPALVLTHSLPTDYLRQWRRLASTANKLPPWDEGSTTPRQFAVAGMSVVSEAQNAQGSPEWMAEVLWVYESRTAALRHFIFSKPPNAETWPDAALIALIAASDCKPSGKDVDKEREALVGIRVALFIQPVAWIGREQPGQSLSTDRIDRGACALAACKALVELQTRKGPRTVEYNRTTVEVDPRSPWSPKVAAGPGFSAVTSTASSLAQFKKQLLSAASESRKSGFNWHGLKISPVRPPGNAPAPVTAAR